MSSKINGRLSPQPCPQLLDFRSRNDSKPFRALQDCIRVKPPGSRAAIRREASELPRCDTCHESSRPRLYACVSCAAVFCHSPTLHSHESAHALSIPGHEIAVDVDRAELFCCACRDLVYDRDFDAAVVLAQTITVTTSRFGFHVTQCKAAGSLAENLRKQRRVDYSLCAPNSRENTIIENHSILLNDATNANLASYEQQDAHEFFISVLDGIHEKAAREKGRHSVQVTSLPWEELKSPLNLWNSILGPHLHLICSCNGFAFKPFVSSLSAFAGTSDCCIAHRVFSGILRSDVMCMACGFTSTTYDPCLDISMDLEPNQGGCLERFTRAEKLGSDQKFFCQKCQVRQESLKQMSIRKLPLVSCFHIKQFEHSSIRRMLRKVDRYLQFPFSLDMAPYLSSSILRSRFGNRIFPFDGEQDAPNEVSSEFELFAVVTHSGKLDAGHYVTYLRSSNHWYKCDDAWIIRVNESIVLAAQGARRGAAHRSKTWLP
ncbi:hypothetical protein F3Y22_tig00009841pilonHSYRG00008 [Hibiscus syriacus]|uniref:ubiquitinyl hydrolase 1 n=1 Tax=Hibiscus syriacus TaxID=106335 RepID=A0A6A3C6E7_HIBSY|nr:hypothetical protein F3Y22_tig00009841pilonHSYRG00008 [Hibiscus syriacus]